MKTKSKKYHWIIDVAAWGTLYGFGTEEEAEEWRSHKANWERCVAKKRKASESEVAQIQEWESLKDLL